MPRLWPCWLPQTRPRRAPSALRRTAFLVEAYALMFALQTGLEQKRVELGDLAGVEYVDGVSSPFSLSRSNGEP